MHRHYNIQHSLSYAVRNFQCFDQYLALFKNGTQDTAIVTMEDE